MPIAVISCIAGMSNRTYSSTRAELALRAANFLLLDRVIRGVKSIVVHLTDGQLQNKHAVEMQSQYLKVNGAKIFNVGKCVLKLTT